MDKIKNIVGHGTDLNYQKGPVVDKTSMEALTILAVACCCFRFLFDGVTTTLFGSTFSLGHIDSGAYAALLAPILAAHSYIKTQTKTNSEDVPKKSEDDELEPVHDNISGIRIIKTIGGKVVKSKNKNNY